MVNVYDTALRHQLVEATAWRPSASAERVEGDIWLSRSNSYPYLVASDAGDLVINTGTNYQGRRHRERFEQALGRQLDVRVIVLTQSHPDHVGGWAAFASPDTETIVHERTPLTLEERRRIAPHLSRRMTSRLFERRAIDGEAPPVAEDLAWSEAAADTTTFVQDAYAFEVGGRRYDALAVPGGETLDGLAVWSPEGRVAWIGNLMGALWGALPHLSTIRGDRPRSAMTFVRAVERVLALEPELLLTGHDEPIRGAARIEREVRKVLDAVRHIHDETLDGMNSGKDLHQLMREVRLPDELEPAPGRGPVSWSVRAIWEEYIGWFKGESITELYGVPQRAVWPDLVELCGGAEALVDRARTRLADGEPLESLHLCEVVLGVEPEHRGARESCIAALEQLGRRVGQTAFDEARLIELELERHRTLLAG